MRTSSSASERGDDLPEPRAARSWRPVRALALAAAVVLAIALGAVVLEHTRPDPRDPIELAQVPDRDAALGADTGLHPVTADRVEEVGDVSSGTAAPTGVATDPGAPAPSATAPDGSPSGRGAPATSPSGSPTTRPTATTTPAAGPDTTPGVTVTVPVDVPVVTIPPTVTVPPILTLPTLPPIEPTLPLTPSLPPITTPAITTPPISLPPISLPPIALDPIALAAPDPGGGGG